MPTVRCPNQACGKSYQVTDESLGGRARCKSCGSVFELAWGGDQSDAVNRNADDVNSKSTGSTHSEVAQLSDTQADFLKTPGQSQIPETLGRFKIKSVLGAGTFGTVYHGYDPQLDREVALKVPNVGVLRTEEEAERFLREARAAASLRHPNICPVHEAYEQDGRCCIVMAFISGNTLSSLITPDKPLSERQIVSLVQKLAQALDLAHKKGVVHRDLKPGNIMFDQEHREPVIMDFGLARRASDSQMTQEGQILGTPAYMSPEQALGDINAIGPASDVYSLGVIFYELLCGQRPFPGFPEQVRAAHYLKTEAEPPSTHRPGINPTLEAICLKAMSRKIEDRLSMAELVGALTHYVPSTQALGGPVQTSEHPSLDTPAAPKDASLPDLFVAVGDKKPAAIKSMNVKPRKRPASRKGFWRCLPPGVKWVAGAGAAALLILLGVFLFIQNETGTIRIEKINESPKLSQADMQGEAPRPAIARLGAGQDGPATAANLVYLDDLPETSWDGAALGKHGNADHGPIIWRRKQPEHSLFTHPHSNATATLTYALSGKFDEFRATIGMTSRPLFPLTFRVWGDDKQLWESPPQTVAQIGTDVQVSVRGVQVLKLSVHCAGAFVNAHAVWIDPRLTPVTDVTSEVSNLISPIDEYEADASLERDCWLKSNGMVFSRTTNGDWTEDGEDGKTYRFQEVDRTSEFVQLEGLTEPWISYRLSKDHSVVLRNACGRRVFD